MLNEFLVLLKGSIPVILAYALQKSFQTLSVFIVGQGSPEDLATAVFSYMFAMSTGWLVALALGREHGFGVNVFEYQALSRMLSTLCSSPFTGSKERHELGTFFQRAFIVISLFYISIAISWVFSEPFFKALGPE